jgi:hypothetical protein
MRTNPKSTQSRRSVALDLAIAAVLATFAVAPAIAVADPDDDASRAARGALEQEQTPADAAQPAAAAIDGQSASTSDAREGSDVRTSYQGTGGTSSGSRSEPRRADEARAVQSGEDAQPVQTMSPSDPEWDSVHQGG